MTNILTQINESSKKGSSYPSANLRVNYPVRAGLFMLIFFIGLTMQAQNFDLVGWATQSGGTTGGSGGDEVTVSTGSALQNAIKDASGPRIIYVNGTITPGNSSGSKIEVKDVDNISIIGVGTSGELNGIGIKIWRSSNIIIRNLKIHNVDIGDKDCISIEGPSDHIWIDHNELYNEFQGVGKDDYDGLLDAKKDAEYLTYSWNYLHDSWKAALLGSSESDDDDRKITMHHNYFENINSRLPLFRGGQGHIFNNVYEDIVTGCINSRLGACVKIENNYFDNANDPWYSADSDEMGDVDVSGNTITNGSSFDSDPTPPGTCNANIPYAYSSVLENASNARSSVLAYVGVGKISTSGGGNTGGGNTGGGNTGGGNSGGGTTTGDETHNFTTSGKSSSFYNISGNLSSTKGTVNYSGLTLTQCLKIESITSISFNATSSGTLTLVFNSNFNGDIKIDGSSKNVSSGILTTSISSGSHTITKDNVANLYYMSLDYSGSRQGHLANQKMPGSELLEVYPNPAANLININLSKDELGTVSIHSLSGQLVKTLDLKQATNQIHVEQLQPGVYMLRVKTASGEFSSRLIKE